MANCGLFWFVVACCESFWLILAYFDSLRPAVCLFGSLWLILVRCVLLCVFFGSLWLVLVCYSSLWASLANCGLF